MLEWAITIDPWTIWVNYAGQLICRFFYPSVLYLWFNQQRMWKANCMHCSTFYIRTWASTDYGIHKDPRTNSMWTPRNDLSFWGVKSFKWIFKSTGVGASNFYLFKSTVTNILEKILKIVSLTKEIEAIKKNQIDILQLNNIITELKKNWMASLERI